MCPHPQVRRGHPQRLETEVFQRLVNEISYFPDVKQVNPFNDNEPLADPRLPELIRYIRTKLPDVWIRLYSNGSLMTSALAEQLAFSGLNEITFSLHASTEDTYKKVMKLHNFERTRERIVNFHRVARDHVKIRVTMVDLHITRPEMEDTKAFWRGRGIEAYVSRAKNWAGNLEDVSILPIYDFENVPSPCHRVMSEMYISSSGKAILCCADWREEVIFGDVNEQSLASIWESPNYRHYRRMHTAHTISSLKLCSTCTYAYRRKRPN